MKKDQEKEKAKFDKLMVRSTTLIRENVVAKYLS